MTAVASLGGGHVVAQYRADEPEVTSSPVAQPRAVPHNLEEFRADYRRAGKPRIALFWNVAFDDATQTERQNVDRTRTTRSEASTGLDKETSGLAGASTLRENHQDGRDDVERITGSRIVDPAKGPMPLSTVYAVELETAFRRQLQSVDVELVSRNFNIRVVKAERDRAGIDPKLIEADAVTGRSDWLLEILLVCDQRAPLGVGFKVSITDVKSGSELLSMYTAARPQLVTLPSYYVATGSGFELRHPTRQPSVSDIGVSLAREIMESVRPVLAAKPG
jgi:hypothetical protein